MMASSKIKKTKNAMSFFYIVLASMLSTYILILLFVLIFNSLKPLARISFFEVLPQSVQTKIISNILSEETSYLRSDWFKYKTIEMLLFDLERGRRLNYDCSDLVKFTGVEMQRKYDSNLYMEPLPAWSRQIIAKCNDQNAIELALKRFKNENDESGICDLLSRLPEEKNLFDKQYETECKKPPN